MNAGAPRLKLMLNLPARVLQLELALQRVRGESDADNLELRAPDPIDGDSRARPLRTTRRRDSLYYAYANARKSLPAPGNEYANFLCGVSHTTTRSVECTLTVPNLCAEENG